MKFALGVLGVFALSTVGLADTVLQPGQDTYISEHGGLGGPNATHGAELLMYAIWANGGAPGLRAYPLVQFDFAPVPSGAVVVGDGKLELFVVGTNFGFQSTRTTSVHEILIPWNAATATFNNFGAMPDVDFGTDVGPALDTQPVPYPAPGDRYVSWTIPGAVIQGWIDNPASNHGLLVWNQEPQNLEDLVFSSVEGQAVPLLTFELAGGCCTDGPGTQTECIVAAEADCVGGGGLFLGQGSDCSNVDCFPLAVTMDSMSATRTRQGVVIEWTTVSEVDTVAFRVLRETRTGREKALTVVANAIPAGGTDLAGASYRFLDNAKESAAAIQYYIEDIDIYGKVTRHGPIAVVGGARQAPAGRAGQRELSRSVE